MAFEGFQLSQVDVGEVSLRVRHGGSGPPVLLLHGYPQTHMMWDQVATALADDFTVIVPDLRGYGDSTAPVTVPDHETYSKRAMARDAIALMRHFGFEQFDLAGHDRGGRVAYRTALDHPHAVRRLSCLDIIPTGEAWARTEVNFMLAAWHWTLLAQPEPLPERLIAADPAFFFFGTSFGAIVRTFPPEAVADYVRCVQDPKVIHAICEDYRAGATFDRALDNADMAQGRKIACPVQLLWGGRGGAGVMNDMLAVWRGWAEDVQGQALDCGHFLPEEKPQETAALLRQFFAEGR